MPIENSPDQESDHLLGGPPQMGRAPIAAIPILVTVQTLLVTATAFTPREADDAERAAAELEWEDGSH